MSDSEIVRTLAEKVMGWKLRDTRPTEVSEHPYYEWRPRGELCIWSHWGAYGTVWNPLKNISDAFMVVEGMREKIPYQTKTQTFSFQLCQTGIPGKWFCSFVTNSGDWSTQSSIDEADSPARAICLAAIAALEGK